jgi:hypothetical protein
MVEVMLERSPLQKLRNEISGHRSVKTKKQRVHTLDSVQEGGEEEIQIPVTPEQLLPASTAPARLVGG